MPKKKQKALPSNVEDDEYKDLVSKLTPLQFSFATAYFEQKENKSQRHAYLVAKGLVGKSYKPLTVDHLASRLYRNGQVQRYLSYLMKRAEDAAVMKVKECLIEYTKVGRLPVYKTRDKAPVVKNKLRALDSLMRHYGGFAKDNEGKGVQIAFVDVLQYLDGVESEQ